MPRGDLNIQVERGLLSPNSAGKLLNCSPNTIRLWVKKGHLKKVDIPFTREICVSGFELLTVAVEWKLPFNSALITAAKRYVALYDEAHIPLMNELEAAYKDPTGSALNVIQSNFEALKSILKNQYDRASALTKTIEPQSTTPVSSIPQ